MCVLLPALPQPGLGFLLVVFVVQWMLGNNVTTLRMSTAKQTDRRIKLMRDVLAGSEALRVNAWEDALASRIRALRAVESRLIWKSLTLLSALEALIFFAPGVATFLVLVTRHTLDTAAAVAANCTLAGANTSTNGNDCADGDGASGLQIEQAYMVLGLCNVMVKQFNTFPRAVKSLKESFVSFRRMERFLLLPEVGEASTSTSPPPEATSRAAAYPSALSSTGSLPSTAPNGTVAVEALSPSEVKVDGKLDEPTVLLDGVTAGWVETVEAADVAAVEASPAPSTAAAAPDMATSAPSTAAALAPFVLRDLSVSVRAGEVCLVMGEVGSGKSSLLDLLLGEMGILSGSMRVRRDLGLGYTPQSAWILAATVRDNILLGRPVDESWYATVVRCCALEADLRSFDHGDLTEIGERGVTVSGGQKARICASPTALALALALSQYVPVS